MKYTLKVHTIWELGKRTNQEDSLYPTVENVSDSDRLFILCDGMGGYDAGEVASNIVCETIGKYVKEGCADAEGRFSNATFETALSHAFDELNANDNGGDRKMGTTMTFLKFHDRGCTIAHIGDSRVYQIRPGKDLEDTEILFQTEDHSLINEWVKNGEMSYEEARKSAQKNVITRAMQAGMEVRPKADLHYTYDIHPGDYFFMCSDGMLEETEEDNLKFIFSEKGGDDENKVKLLTQVTSNNSDNHSAFLIHVMEVIDPIPQERTEEIPVLNTLKGIMDTDEDEDEDSHKENTPSVKESAEEAEAQEEKKEEEEEPEKSQPADPKKMAKGSVEKLNSDIMKAGKTEGIWLRIALSVFALICALAVAYAFYNFLNSGI